MNKNAMIHHVVEPARKIRVLVAEDHDADVFLIREALNEQLANFELEVLNDGEKASKFVDRMTNGLERRPDVVLLDLNLPRCDGKEVLQKLRHMPGGESVPVVIITSSDSPRDREEVARLGASCYFRKSSDLNEFMQLGKVVNDLLRDQGWTGSASID